MKVHINQIPLEGKHIEGEEDGSILDVKEPGVAVKGPVRYALDVGLSDGGLFATGKLAVDVEFQCVNCLEPFVYPVRLDYFACQIELEGSEMVDLTEPIREDILLDFPAHPHCDWSGQHVCPFRAAQPVRDEALPTEDGDTLETKRDVWGALDQLKLK